MINIKEEAKNKRGGEAEFNINLDDTVFYKGTNVRRGKGKPRFDKGVVVGEAERNVVTIATKNRDARIPVKDIKRPSQERLRPGAVPGGSNPAPGTSASVP